MPKNPSILSGTQPGWLFGGIDRFFHEIRARATVFFNEIQGVLHAPLNKGHGPAGHRAEARHLLLPVAGCRHLGKHASPPLA